MQLSVTGKQLDDGEALCRHVEPNLSASVTKYFNGAVEGNIVFSRAAHLFRAEFAGRSGRGTPVQGRGEAIERYPTFAMAPAHTAEPWRQHQRERRSRHRMNNLPEQD